MLIALNTKKLFLFKFYLNAIYAGDPNMDLVLANGGSDSSINNSLSKRITVVKPDFSNIFGKDSELERSAKSMRAYLNGYKQINNPTVEEWANLKNIAVSAVKGNCKAIDKLFEAKIIPRTEYEKLTLKCGRLGILDDIDKNIKTPKMLNKVKEFLGQERIVELKQNKPIDDLNHLTADNKLDTGLSLNYGIMSIDPDKSPLNNVPNIKRAAVDIARRNLEPLKAKLNDSSCPFKKEAIGRLNLLKQAAEEVVDGVEGALDKFVELQRSSKKYIKSIIDKCNLNDEIHNPLLTDEQIHKTHLPISHEVIHAENQKEADLDKALHLKGPHIKHHLNSRERSIRKQAKAAFEIEHHEIEDEIASRVEDFVRRSYENAIESGIPEEDAAEYSKQAKALTIEFENSMASGMPRADAIDKAIATTNNTLGKTIPEEIIENFRKLYSKPYSEDTQTIEVAKKPVVEISPSIQSIVKDSLPETLKMSKAIKGLADTEVKIQSTDEKIKKSNSTTNTKITVDIQKEHLEDVDVAFNRKQIEILNEKKRRYEKILSKNQPKSIKYATTLKELNDLEKQLEEILQNNKKIVQQESVMRKEASTKSISVIMPAPDNSVEEMNSKHELSIEKKNARMLEETLAREAEDHEVQEAQKIAAFNVKRLGGSDEDAAKEGEKASILKRKMIESAKMKIAKRIKEKLSKQIGDLKATDEAQHIAMTHNGKNPIGNSILELQDHMVSVEVKEGDEQMKKYEPADDRNLVIKLIPDNVGLISANNSVILLPLNGIPSAKAKTIEEENIKRDLENLRDEIRNKVTKKNFNSGLVVIKGIEGFMNLPESCKEVDVKKGVVYYDQAGYNFMVSQKIDVTPLVAIYSRGNEPVYYKAEVKDMKMKLPSILNTNPQKLLYNEFESINIDFAKKLEIVSGEVICEPWSIFSSRMRPKVYKGLNKGADEVPDSIKREFDQIENDKDGLKGSDVRILKNPDGMIMAEIQPQFGITSKMKIGDAVKKAKEISARGVQNIQVQSNLNIADEMEMDYTKEFMNSVEKELINKKEYQNILNEQNPITAFNSTRIENIKNETVQVQQRPGNNEQSNIFNNMVENASSVSSTLRMSEKDFIDSISKVDNLTISKIQNYFLDVSNSLDYHKKLAQMDQEEFVSQIKQYFPNQQVSEVVKIFFTTISKVLKIPNKIEGMPVTNIQKITCCLDNVSICTKVCNSNKIQEASPRYSVVPIASNSNVSDASNNIRIVQPLNPLLNPNVPGTRPLGLCSSLKSTGCLLLGNVGIQNKFTLPLPPPKFLTVNNCRNSAPIPQLNSRPGMFQVQQRPIQQAGTFSQPCFNSRIYQPPIQRNTSNQQTIGNS